MMAGGTLASRNVTEDGSHIKRALSRRIAVPLVDVSRNEEHGVLSTSMLTINVEAEWRGCKAR